MTSGVLERLKLKRIEALDVDGKHWRHDPALQDAQAALDLASEELVAAGEAHEIERESFRRFETELQRTIALAAASGERLRGDGGRADALHRLSVSEGKLLLAQERREGATEAREIARTAAVARCAKAVNHQITDLMREGRNVILAAGAWQARLRPAVNLVADAFPSGSPERARHGVAGLGVDEWALRWLTGDLTLRNGHRTDPIDEALAMIDKVLGDGGAR